MVVEIMMRNFRFYVLIKNVVPLTYSFENTGNDVLDMEIKFFFFVIKSLFSSSQTYLAWDFERVYLMNNIYYVIVSIFSVFFTHILTTIVLLNYSSFPEKLS